MMRLIVLVLCIGASLAQNACETNRLHAVKSGQQKARGSNLGSWLILEGWMAPGPWDQNGCNKNNYPGSYMLEKCLGSKAASVMEHHWSTWITENDFAEMSKHGVNVVRLPVGWWQIYDPQGGTAKAKLAQKITPLDHLVGGLAYIDKAFEWGKKHGIAVLLDMHAPPGSQNGNDHSSPENPGQKNWEKYPANVAQTVDSMGLYAERYGKHEALYGFCLLNEPANTNIGILQSYYKRAYERVRQHSPDSYILINPLISPFESGTESHWTSFMNPNQGFTKVAMDLHYYSCFGGAGDTSDSAKAIAYINNDRRAQIADYAKKNPKLMFIGEWSACHKSGDRNGDFAKAEVNAYDQASLGWTFWSWTNGQPGNQWSLKTAFNSGWIPNQYPC